MDLNDLDLSVGANEGRFMQFLHPTKKTPLVTDAGEKIGITFLGYDSDLSKKLRTKAMNDGLNQKRGAKVTAEQIESRAVRQIAKHALSWQYIKEDGLELEFSQDELIRLLNKYEWMRDQSDEFIGDRSAFLEQDETA